MLNTVILEGVKFIIVLGLKTLLKSKTGGIESKLALELMDYIIKSKANPITKEILSDALSMIGYVEESANVCENNMD